MTNFLESIDFKVHSAVAAKACLPARGEDPQPAGTRCWAAGWGRMAWKGKVANILQEVDLPLISDATCAKTNNERYFKPVRKFKIPVLFSVSGPLDVRPLWTASEIMTGI